MSPDKVREIEVTIIIVSVLLFVAMMITSAHCQVTPIQHVVFSEGEK